MNLERFRILIWQTKQKYYDVNPKHLAVVQINSSTLPNWLHCYFRMIKNTPVYVTTEYTLAILSYQFQ